jgi:hypothetical protein
MSQYSNADDILRDAAIAQLLPSPFITSWIARAREESLSSSDPKKRAAAWAFWALTQIQTITSTYADRTRSYNAFTLPGRFYDPNGRGPTIRPHLEIPASTINSPDPEFPDRLSEMGSTLRSAWWIPSEVKAVRRNLFPKNYTAPLEDFLNTLHRNRPGLEKALIVLLEKAAQGWSTIEEKLITSPQLLAEAAAGDFSTEEINEYFPLCSPFNLEIVYDAKFREINDQAVSRRIGVWSIVGTDPGTQAKFSLGVATPRLTAQSLFRDELFEASSESCAALLVRGLLIQRIYQRFISRTYSESIVAEEIVESKSINPFRALAARSGQKLPEASVEALVHFTQVYKTPQDAWSALKTWSDEQKYTLTVTEPGFIRAFTNAKRLIRRAEPPSRDDINVILPIIWDSGQVRRVTFTKYAKT